jgi:hypothetical protein
MITFNAVSLVLLIPVISAAVLALPGYRRPPAVTFLPLC